MSFSVCSTAPLSDAAILDGFCAGQVPVQVSQPRSIIALDHATDFLTLERGTGSVLVAEDLDGDGIPESIRTLVSADGLNHGLAITTTHLYASRDTEVYRWPYDPETRRVTNDTSELIIENMNADGNGGAPQGHRTRTLAVDQATNLLYVSIGSNDNIDPNSYRSRIRVFPIDDDSIFPVDFMNGEVFADGIRNEVGIAFNPTDGVLWGVGNSADNLERLDLGLDIYNDNPCEELHRFAAAENDTDDGLNYGYPFCWREYRLDDSVALGRGTAWAWPSFIDDGIHNITDEQCRDNFDTPVLAMQAHSAPLGLTFYQYKNENNRPDECEGVEPFPESMDGDLFISFHGSWNREIPTGYKVVHVAINENGTGVVGGIGADPVDLLKHEGNDSKWEDGFRPVDVSFDACGRLLVSSDGSRTGGSYPGEKIVRIERIADNSTFIGDNIADNSTFIGDNSTFTNTQPLTSSGGDPLLGVDIRLLAAIQGIVVAFLALFGIGV